MPDFAIWQFKKPYCLEVISNCEGPFIYVDSNLLTKETSLFKIWEQIQCLKEFNICNRKAFNLTKIIKYQVFCRYLLKKKDDWLIFLKKLAVFSIRDEYICIFNLIFFSLRMLLSTCLKVMQMLSKILRLNFYNLKIIFFIDIII